MAKLTGAKKKAFLERMAKGRRQAKRANPKNAAKAKRAAPKKKAAKKRTNPRPLRGKAKAEFLARMARGRKKSASKGNPKKKAGRKGRRNSEEMDAAVTKFREFHGKEPGKIVEYSQQHEYPATFAEMGKLKELRIDLDMSNRDFPLEKFGDCQAVCTPDGRNIYFIGGDQSIDFDALDMASDKDFAELGPCTYIVYDTIKGFHDFVRTNYWHRFGEENGVYPTLVYDRLNQTLFLIGGDYQVRPEGIVN